MYTLIITGYDYHGKLYNKVYFNLTRREAKVLASRCYNPEYLVKCSLLKCHRLFYSGR